MRSRLIQKTAVRDYARAMLAAERPALASKFTRISSDFFEAIEASTRAAVVNRVRGQSSCGKTLR